LPLKAGNGQTCMAPAVSPELASIPAGRPLARPGRTGIYDGHLGLDAGTFGAPFASDNKFAGHNLWKGLTGP
jgi:hypothetical protein